ncbi:MAG: hypothetical protein ACK56F_29425, partial [bacterium]
MAEFRLAKKISAVLLETSVTLKDFEDYETVIGVAPPETLFLKSLEGNQLLASQIGSMVVVPARHALTPTVA